MADEPRLPDCFGNYTRACATNCAQPLAWECLEYARLEHDREILSQGRDRDPVPPGLRHLRRLGYPDGVLF